MSEVRRLDRILLLSLCCVWGHPPDVQAQALYSKDSKITVGPNTTITVQGGVANEGVMANDGHLRVSGQWINSGVYQPGQGRVTFNSTSEILPQIIHHNGQAFNRITLSGGTKKILVSDMEVAQEIRFDEGIIEVAGSSKIVFGPEVKIFGASDHSHIHGPVVQKGGGHKYFPIGNGALYLPVELTDISDPASVIGVQGFESDHLILPGGAPVSAVSDKRYWRINVASGSLGNSQVVLPLRDESWISNPAQVVVVQSASPSENFVNLGRSYMNGDTGMGQVTSAARVSMPFVAVATAAAELVVYNAVSPNGDGYNDYLRIENIENYIPNKFTLFTRWGDRVFEIDNYNNEDRRFTGRANLRGDRELGSGTYFYVLDIRSGESLRGFITLKQ